MTLSRREVVNQAIRFGFPERVPIVFWNRDQTEGDIMLYHLALGAPGDGTPNAWNWTENEWGYGLRIAWGWHDGSSHCAVLSGVACPRVHPGPRFARDRAHVRPAGISPACGDRLR